MTNPKEPNPDQLLADIKNSIGDMQNQMQSTYQNLQAIKVSGKSIDDTVKVTLTATYGFEDIDFTKQAMEGGVSEFKTRIKEAFSDAVKKVQEATQQKTMELFQQMQIPDEIRQMSMQDQAMLGKKNDDTDK